MDERDERARLKRLRDFADLQDENAGRDTGKMRRFTREADRPEAGQEQRPADTFLLLETLTYQQRIDRLRSRLAELNRASLEALRDAERELREVQEHAPIDEHGRRMYRTADGRTAYYEDGTEVSRMTQDDTDWTGTSSWELFQEKQTAVDDAREFRERVEQAQAELESGEDLTDARLEELELEFDDVPKSVQAQLGRSHMPRTSAAREHVPADASGNGPSSVTAFNGAADRSAVQESLSPGRAPPQPTETFTP